MTGLDKAWLPEGHHLGLHIEHAPSGDGGGFVTGGWKLIWHTTEGDDLRAMQRVLTSKRAEPHVVIGRKGTGRQDFTAVQFIPFTQAARALEHPGGTLDTNNAHAIQVEICGYAKDAAGWGDDMYAALGALTLLIEHRVGIPRSAPRPFTVPAQRFTPRGFINAKGHIGHGHAASQPGGHWDPGKLNTRRLFAAARRAAATY